MKYIKHVFLEGVDYQECIENPFDEIPGGTIYEIRDDQMDFYVGLDHIPNAINDLNPKTIGWWYGGSAVYAPTISFPPHIKFAAIPDKED